MPVEGWMHILGYWRGTGYLAVFIGRCDASLRAFTGHLDSILGRTLIGIDPVEPWWWKEGGRGRTARSSSIHRYNSTWLATTLPG